jgi:hypothetical protein
LSVLDRQTGLGVDDGLHWFDSLIECGLRLDVSIHSRNSLNGVRLCRLW